MKLHELAELVKQMRESQVALLMERTPQLFSKTRELERRVDKAVNEILDGQKKLF